MRSYKIYSQLVKDPSTPRLKPKTSEFFAFMVSADNPEEARKKAIDLLLASARLLCGPDVKLRPLIEIGVETSKDIVF